MTNGVTELGQESSFDSTDASYFYSYTFTVTADSDVVLQNTLYQPVTSAIGRFMGNSGNDAVAAAQDNFDTNLLPYFSSARVSNLALGGGLVGNLATTFVSNQGMNSFAVAGTTVKNVIPEAVLEWNIPLIGLNGNQMLDWVIDKTRSYAPLVAEAANNFATDMISDQIDNLMPGGDGEGGLSAFDIPQLPF